MHWTDSHVRFNLFLARFFKFEEAAKKESHHEMGKTRKADDIANTISFLAGSDGGWINAQVIRTNGGFA
jgi:3-oxoacyl-[acyl-carrier protein] reductase